MADESAHGAFILQNRANIRACTDLSDGGLALAAFELAEFGAIGVTLTTADIPLLYGEDQARYLIACSPTQAIALEQAATTANVPLTRFGHFGGDIIQFGTSHATLKALSSLYRTAFAAAVG